MLQPPIWTGNGQRPGALWDTECFWNFWFLGFQTMGGFTWQFAIRDGQHFSESDRRHMANLFESYRTFSFNGLYYDEPMMRAVLMGYTTEQLKQLNDLIIIGERRFIKGKETFVKPKPWELGLGDWKPADHVDLKSVCPGAGSQNAFAARIGHHTIEDFEVDFNAPLTPEGMQVAASKCINDLGKLRALHGALQPQLRQRERIGSKYGINVLSKSDAQVAEAVLRRRCEDSTGRTIYSQKIERIDWNYSFRYDAPVFIQYSTPQLQHALALVRRAIFRIQPPSGYRDDEDEKGRCVPMPPELESLEIAIGRSVYKMGIGGLHSQEKKLVAVSNDTHQVLMPDVTSYYPNLMVNAGASPPALGDQFTTEYDSIKKGRVFAKHTAKEIKSRIAELRAELAQLEAKD